MRNVPLLRRLYVLAAAAILPLAAMSGAGLLLLAQQQREQIGSNGLDLTRAMAASIDAEINRSVAALEILATASSLEKGDIPTFQDRVQKVMATRPDWLVVILADAAGRVVFNSSKPAGEPLPPVADSSSFEKAVATKAPVVGNLARGPRGELAVAVRMPLSVNGELRYVLTSVVRPKAFVEVLDRQRIPSDWLVSVFDGNGLRVARSRAHEQHLGELPSPSLQQLLDSGRSEMIGTTQTLEGQEVYTAFSRAPQSRWTVVLGIPTSAVTTALYHSLAVYGGGLLLSFAVSLLAALAIARSISRPIRELRQAAQAVGHGAVPRVQPSLIREVQEVADTLVAASVQRARGEAEREQLLKAERATRTEIELARREADAARLHAEAANRTKDEFLAMLSHELRNPLAPIVTALHLMAMRDGTVHVNERRIIERQVAHLSRLVDDLLDVSRITRGKVQLQRERVDLKQAVRRALEMVQPQLSQRTRPVDVQLPVQPVFVMGDGVRLAQIVINLLGNAAKFTPESGRIALRLSVVDGTAEIAVDDDGCGIAPELLPHVFDLFVQGRQVPERHAGGLGLGLAIVKNLAEMHGGSVTAYSEGEGRGSRFVVRIPLAQEEAAQPPRHMPSRMLTRAPGRSILIVDDNPDAAETLATVLRELGHDVRAAEHASAALDMLRSFVPDVALLDIGLPDVDGCELARRMKADPRMSAVRLIALTGYGGDLDRVRITESGFEEHLVKPVTVDRLLAAIDQVFSAPVA